MKYAKIYKGLEFFAYDILSESTEISKRFLYIKWFCMDRLTIRETISRAAHSSKIKSVYRLLQTASVSFENIFLIRTKTGSMNGQLQLSPNKC